MSILLDSPGHAIKQGRMGLFESMSSGKERLVLIRKLTWTHMSCSTLSLISIDRSLSYSRASYNYIGSPSSHIPARTSTPIPTTPQSSSIPLLRHLTDTQHPTSRRETSTPSILSVAPQCPNAFSRPPLERKQALPSRFSEALQQFVDQRVTLGGIRGNTVTHLY
jgi:hypothetical protein